MKHTLEEVKNKIKEFVRDSGCWEGSDFTQFAFEAKSMLVDLVKEVEKLRNHVQGLQETISADTFDTKEENKRLREALEKIANGRVWSAYDEKGEKRYGEKN